MLKNVVLVHVSKNNDHLSCILRKQTAYLKRHDLLRRAIKIALNRRVHALDCIMGNQGNMAGNSEVCMEIHSKYNVHDSTLWTFPFINQANKFMFTTEMN